MMKSGSYASYVAAGALGPIEPDDDPIETIEQVGERIGKAIFRDVIADDLPRKWTGIDPQDAAQIPVGMELAAVEAAAEKAFLAAVQRERDEEAARECRIVRDLERGGCGDL